MSGHVLDAPGHGVREHSSQEHPESPSSMIPEPDSEPDFDAFDNGMDEFFASEAEGRTTRCLNRWAELLCSFFRQQQDIERYNRLSLVSDYFDYIDVVKAD